MKYQWILFDADNTLFDFDKAAVQALKRTFFEYELPFSEEVIQLYHSVNQGLWKMYEKGILTADELKPKRFSIMFDRLGLEADSGLFSEDYLGNLSEESVLIEDVPKLLSQLNHFQLLVITNGFAKVQRPRYKGSILIDHFHDIVISDEVGAAKPESKIFDVAFEKMGQPNREQVLIVGDSLSSDIQGGINYGIDTCWYNPKEKGKPDSIRPTYEIQHILELLNLL